MPIVRTLPSRPRRRVPAPLARGACTVPPALVDAPTNTPPHVSAGARRASRVLTVSLAAAALGLAAPAAGAKDARYDVDAETGYRMERYRAPVPDSVPGGTTIDTATMRERLAEGTLVPIDVFPPKGLGADPLDGSWIVSEGHETLDGATWLPEVGRGHLTPAHEDYFRRNLERLTGGDPATPVAFFCTADCWQSWNAARRAARMGYTNVHWYPLGTDGWVEEGGELVPARPLNFLDDSLPDAAPDPSAEAATFPKTARIALVDADGVELDIGTVRFSEAADGSAAIAVDVGGEAFSEHFLNMYPFRCLADAPEWFCHLPYPYALDDTVAPDDLTDLEYRLLFVRKSAAEFGIDAWNGVYYTLTPSPDGGFDGALLDGDLNVLAGPPADPDTRPIDLAEFTADERERRRFPTLVIRP